VALTLVVCLTAVIGNIVFRFMPLFAVLTVLVSYQLLSGWHVIYTRAAGPNAIDASLLIARTVLPLHWFATSSRPISYCRHLPP
jgi:hypothetical protein